MRIENIVLKQLVNNEDYTNIQNLSGIIESSGEIGSFELGNLEISIKSIETQDIIKC